MPGMNNGLNTNDPTVVSAFQTSLLHQGLIVLLILAIVGIGWNLLRARQLRGATGDHTGATSTVVNFDPREPAARRFIRISFGLLWILDGILQGQSSMPLGLVPQAIQPTASSSPTWVQHIVNTGATVWNYHPVPAAAAAVWIQVGIGVLLLCAPRGNWSRLAGAVSVGWGLVVWVFGEAFGGIFAPGLTWLFGAPGAVIFYCVAGVLLALPERLWAEVRLGRVLLRFLGGFFLAMGLLQAWPGRGFWQGQDKSGAKGTLATMVAQMSQSPQPHPLASAVASFGRFDASHGWAVNLSVVVALFVIGGAFVSARPRLVRVGVVAAAVLCLADWILVEDLGFMGGTGTDPNSMIPMTLLFGAGYLAITRLASVGGKGVVPITVAAGDSLSWQERLRANPSYAFRSLAAVAAVGITLVGVVPMAAAATNPNADAILYQAVNGTPNAANTRTPPFHLVDQNGQAVSLNSLRGKTVGLTFLDPVCTSDCPIIAQEFRIADGLLGPQAARVELLAIDANPRYTQTAFLRSFDEQEGLEQVPNWRYLTGSLEQLENVWNAFGVQVSYEPGGAMIAHSDVAYVLDNRGRTRYILGADPGPASSATKSSFAVTLAGALRKALSGS